MRPSPHASLQSSLQVLGGLDHLNAKAGNDGAGDHARANATFLESHATDAAEQVCFALDLTPLVRDRKSVV